MSQQSLLTNVRRNGLSSRHVGLKIRRDAYVPTNTAEVKRAAQRLVVALAYLLNSLSRDHLFAFVFCFEQSSTNMSRAISKRVVFSYILDWLIIW